MHLSLRELCYLEVGLCKRYRKTLQGKQLSLVKKIEVQNEGMKKTPLRLPLREGLGTYEDRRRTSLGFVVRGRGWAARRWLRRYYLHRVTKGADFFCDTAWRGLLRVIENLNFLLLHIFLNV